MHSNQNSKQDKKAQEKAKADAEKAKADAEKVKADAEKVFGLLSGFLSDLLVAGPSNDPDAEETRMFLISLLTDPAALAAADEEADRLFES